MRPLRRAGLALVVITGACVTDLSVGPRVVASLSISPNAPILVVGAERQLLAIARDSNGVPFVGLTTTWSTNGAGVATVGLTGIVAGMSVGTATITASSGGHTATALVTVSPAPVIALSSNTRAFSGTPGAPDPAPQTVTITNTGGGSLDDVGLGTVVYGAGATGWLAASLDQASAPATLTLTVTTGTIALGSYSATVPVTAATASNSPQNVTVTFTVAAGPAATLALSAGDNQSASVNTAVTAPPAVIARDASNNPVAGVQVTFAIAGGGGSLSGTNPATTNAAGVAQTGWILGSSLGANTLTASAAGLAGSPVTFNATGTAGPAAQIAASAGNAQTTTVNSAVSVSPAVIVTDAQGNPVAGFAVTFALASGGGNISGANQTTNAGGLAQVGGWVLGQTAGANSLTATASGLAGSPVTFTATGTPGPPTQFTKCGGDTQTATVGTAVAVNPCVAIRDAFNNPIAGMTITFSIGGGGGILTGTNPATTDVAGQARIGWVLGTTAGANALSADATGLPTLSFTATGAPGAATQIVKTAGDAQTGTVGFPIVIPPQVQARDQFGNGVPSVVVTFAVASGGGSLTGTNPATTNAAGFAQIGWTLGIAIGANSLTATATGLTGSPLTFTATGTSGGATQIAASAGNGQSATVNSAVAVPPQVLVTDGLGNPVSGVAVTFAIGLGGGNISGANQTTNASGLAQVGGWVLGQTAGTNTLTATAGGLTGSPVTFTATGTSGAATQIALSAGNGQSATVNTAVATPPRVVVRDAFNNPVAGVSVTFAVTGGGGSLSGTNPATTDALGLAQIGWTLGQTAGANTMTATATGLAGSPVSFTATGTAGVATQLVKTAGDGQSAPVGAALPTLPQVQVRDQFGNGVPGITVTFAVTSGGGSLTGPNPVATNATGFAQIGWTLGGAAGSQTISATASGLAGSPATFTASATTTPATQIALSQGDGQTATVNTAVATAPRVLVRDASNNPVQGVAVTFAVTAGGGAVTGTNPAITDVNGFAQVGWTLGTGAGTNNNTLTATTPGLAGSPVTFTASATAGAATQIALNQGDAQSATVNTAVATPPRVVVRDAFNNPRAGVAVTFAVTAGGGSLTGTNPATTDASGFAQVGWTLGTAAGTNNNALAATAAGLTGSPVTFTASATAGVATQIALSQGDGQGAPVNTSVAIPPRVVVRDAFNNPKSGVAVTFAVTAGGGALTGTNPATTDANGLAQIGWTLGPSSGTNNNTLTATATGLAGSPVTFTASASAGGATQIALSQGDGQTATVNTAVATAPRVLVRDASNNPVAGVAVTFAVAAGGGSLTGTNPAFTDGSGFAQIGWTLGTAAGSNNNTLTATATGLAGSPVTFTASATAGTATQIALSQGNGQSATVNTAVATAPRVLVRDAFNNPKAGVAVTFAVTAGGGSLTGANPATTDVNGFASIGWTLGTTAGLSNNTLTATATGLAGSPVTFTATATAGVATQIAVSQGNGQSATVGTAVATPPRVVVRDALNNPVALVAVTFAVTGGGGSLTGTNPAITDASGFASIGWTLGTTAGSNNQTLTATATGLTGSPVTFTASATAGAATQIALNQGNGQSATVGTAVATAPRVLVRDASNNPVAGVAVTFAVTGGGGSLTGTNPAITDVNGFASIGWSLGTTAGTNNQTLTATATGLTGSPITFTASATAGTATQIAVSQGNGQSATVNTAVATPPRVVARDAFNNPVTGVSVTFAVTAGGGSLTGTNPAVTDVNGFASIGWTLGTTAGSNNQTLTATTTGLAGSPVTFTASATAGTATQIAKIAGDNQSAEVSSPVPVPPRVQVQDAFGNGVGGATVTFAVTGGAGALTGTNPATTDPSGFAQIGWTLGSVVGANALAATATSVAGTPAVTFTATSFAGGATTLLPVAGNNQSDTVGATLAIQYQVRVTDGTNGVAGIPVSWAVTGGGGTINPPTSFTDGSGFASATRILSTTAGTHTATASAGALTGSPATFTATATHGAATQIVLDAGNNQSATVGTAVATPPSVVVRDQFGNAVPSVNVTFTVTGGAGTVSPPSPATIGTGVTGVAALTSWTLGNTAGSNNNTLTATAAGLSGSPVAFTASATAGAATQITLSQGNNQSATVNTAVATAPRVLVRDALNNPVASVAVTFAVTGGGGSLTGANPATTDGNGFASIGWTLGTTAGTNNQTLTATATGLTGSPVTFTASATAGAATQIAVSQGNNQSATVGTAVATPPRVVVRDAFGNPAQSVAVTFAVTAGGGSLTGANPATTDGNGFASIGWTLGTAAGSNNNTMSASATGLAGSPVTFTASATTGTATQIALSQGNNQSATVNTAVAIAPRVLVRDAFNNPVSGVSVTFAVTGGAGSLTGTNPASTDVNGFASIGWTLGTAAGTNNNTLTATATGLSGSPVTFTASATPGTATQLALSQGNGQSATVNTAVATPPRVVVRDAFSNPVTGVSVTFAVTAGGGSLTGTNPATTDGSGFASIGWTLGTAAGSSNNTLTATATGLSGSPVTFIASATAGTATQITLSQGNNQTATVGTAVATAPRVLVRDAFSNPVTGTSVTFAVTAGGGSLTGTNPTTTDVNGFASIGWTLGPTAGTNNHTLTATATGLAGSPVTFTASATAGPATQITLSQGTGQSATVNTAVATAPRVLVRDASNNPVQNVAVTFAVTAGGGSVTGTNPATTDVNGLAQVGWTLGTTAGTNNQTLTATATGLVGSPVTFTATATADAPSAAQSSVAATSPITASSGASQSTITVTVRDQFSNAIGGANVTWSATGTGNTPVSTTGTTDGSGVFNAGRLSSTVAQSKTVSAVVNGTVSITQTATVVVNPAVASAAFSTLAAGTASITACATSCVAGSTASTITVTARDAFSNVIPGAAVVLASSGANNAFAPTGSGNADGSGVFTAAFSSTTAQAKTISATVNGTGVTQTAAVTVTPDVAATIALDAGNNQSAVVGTAVTTPPSVIVRDQFTNPVTLVPVTFAVTGGGGSVNPVTAVNTNGLGIAQATSWTLGTTAGTNNNTLTATSGALVGSPVLFTASATVGAPSAAQSSVAATSPITASNGASQSVITVTVRDAFSNVIPSANVTWSSTGSDNTLTSSTGTTDGLGVFNLGRLSSTRAESKTISAIVNPGPSQVVITQTANVVVDPDVFSAAQSLVSAAPGSIIASSGSVSSTITVTVRDQFNNPLSGRTVDISATGGGNAVTDPVGTTNGSGVATGSLSSTQAQLKTVSATANGSAITQTAAVTVTHAAAFSIASNGGNGQSAVVNNLVGIAPSVLVLDQFGNPVQSQNVVFTVTGGAGTLVPASPATIGTSVLGVAQVTSWRVGTTAGINNNTLSAAATGLSGSPVVFTASATVGAPSATLSTVAATSPITACQTSCVAGSVLSTITVTVRDGFSNLISGANVTWSATGANNTPTNTTGTTDGSGVFNLGRLSSTFKESKTISAVINGSVTITPSATVVVNAAAVSTSLSNVVAGTTTISACSVSCVAGSTASTITITARDQFSNLANGVLVTYSSTGSNNTFNPVSGSGVTNASGVFTTNFNSTFAQAKTINASAGGVAITQTAAVTVNAATASQTAVNAGNSQTARVGVAVATDPQVLVRDPFNNPVTGATVTFTATVGGGIVSGGSQVTSAGFATVTSWTLGSTSADAADGTMANTLNASVSPCSGSCSVNFGASAIYTWSGDAGPILSTGGPCASCHNDGVNVVVFTRSPNNTVGVLGQTSTACDSFVRVIANNAAGSAMYSKANNTPVCGAKMPPGVTNLTAAQLKIIRAWINNNALNN